jgi:hypothetical protein
MASPGRWYRVHFQWGVLACGSVLAVAALGALALGVNDLAPVVARVVAGLFILPVVAYAVYTYTAGIGADELGVTVRQWRLRTRHVPWARVSGFRTVRGSGSRTSDYVAVDTIDGKTWTTSGLTCQRRSRARQFAAALEAERKRWAAARWWE